MSIVAAILLNRPPPVFREVLRTTYAPEEPDRRKKKSVGFKPNIAGTKTLSKIIRANLVKLLSTGKEFFIEEIVEQAKVSRPAAVRHLRKMIENKEVSLRVIERGRHIFKGIS